MRAMWCVDMDSPVGPLHLVADDTALCAMLFAREPPDRVPHPPQETPGPDHPVLQRARSQLEEYFAGTRRVFDLPLRPQGTPFQQQCWDVLRTIPYGETLSYGQQAQRLGDPGKARAVGAANGRNPLGIIVPCHRVVAHDGALVGFGGGLEVKRWLLAFEERHTTRQQRLFP